MGENERTDPLHNRLMKTYMHENSYIFGCYKMMFVSEREKRERAREREKQVQKLLGYNYCLLYAMYLCVLDVCYYYYFG